MSRYISPQVVIAASLSMPVAGAQAGFFTDVAKGTVENAARAMRSSPPRMPSALGRFVGPSVGRCILKRATGRQC